MARAEYRRIQCKSALNRVTGMGFKWSLNPYRGCVHACHYCYARATHVHLGMNADEDFSSRILVKENVVEVLRAELGRRGWTRERVHIGTATDAYQPIEGIERLTRRSLEALIDHHTPASIVTKSTLVVRDIDLLSGLQQVAGAKVNFTLTTLDESIWRAMETGTPHPRKRLAVMARLAEAGIPVGVFLAPVMPGITDGEVALRDLMAAARDHGASWLWAAPLRLQPSVKEHYFDVIDAAYPDMSSRYRRGYTRADATDEYRAWLARRIDRLRTETRFGDDPFADGDPKTREVQLPLLTA